MNSQFGKISMPLDESTRKSIHDQSVDSVHSSTENRANSLAANADTHTHEFSSRHARDDHNMRNKDFNNSSSVAVKTPDGTVKRLIKLRIWDENDPKVSSIVTVEVDVPLKKQDATHADNMNSEMLKVGGAVQVQKCNTESFNGLQLVQIVQVSDDSTKDIAVNNSSPREATIKKDDKAKKQPSELKDIDPFIIPSVVSATVTKSSPDQKVGLAFRKANSTIVVEKILPGSVFDGSDVAAGQECLCINSHRIRSARRAAEIVR